MIMSVQETSENREPIAGELLMLDDDTEPSDEEVDKLTDVRLNSFTATPSTIGPFGASLLNWNVGGVKPGVRILLENSQVPAVSHRTVQPPSTHIYHLAAAAGSARKSLGTATVHVNVSTCADVALTGAFTFMRNLLKTAIEQEPTTYWSSFGPDKLSVEATQGNINFHMLFRMRLDNAPDLWVDLNGSFGLAVAADGAFVATGRWAEGSAQFPRWFWFLGGFIAGMALALNDANQKATEQANALIDHLIFLLNLLRVPSEGKQVRSVQVGHRDGFPAITYVECDDTELQVLANALSGQALIA
jgi:hypothetical protein